jgi:hypothetical protein
MTKYLKINIIKHSTLFCMGISDKTTNIDMIKHSSLIYLGISDESKNTIIIKHSSLFLLGVYDKRKKVLKVLHLLRREDRQVGQALNVRPVRKLDLKVPVSKRT